MWLLKSELDVGALAVARPDGRVETIGKVAHLHLAHEERYGRITRADSLAIRRNVYGDRVRSTANLFGKKGEGAILYRGVPHGQRVKDADPVHLTDEGLRLARAYRAAHQLGGVPDA